MVFAPLWIQLNYKTCKDYFKMEGANCGLHPLIHTLLKFALALDVGISQDGCVGKRKPLDTLSRIEGLMKSPLTDTDHRYGWSQAYGDLGLNSPLFIVRRIGDVAQLCQYEKPPF